MKSGERLALLYVPVGFEVRFCVVALVLVTKAQRRPPTWSDAADTSVLPKAARVNLTDGGAVLIGGAEERVRSCTESTRPIAKILYHHSSRFPTPNGCGYSCTSPKSGVSFLAFLSQPACPLQSSVSPPWDALQSSTDSPEKDFKVAYTLSRWTFWMYVPGVP